MKTNLNSAFLLILIILVGICSYFIFKPFLVALFLAFVLSQLFKKWYEKINLKFGNRPSLASLTLCILLFFILAMPLFITGGLVAKEASSLYQKIQETNWQDYSLSFPNVSFLNNFNINLENFNLKNLISQNSQEISQDTKSFGNALFFVAKKTYQGTSHFLFMAFVTFFTLYYLFKDGDKMIKKIMLLSPLKNSEEKKLLDNFTSISKATLKGSLVIAILQGFLIAGLFGITGVSAPILWGVVSIVVCLIPILGAFIIWLPAGLAMLFLGYIWQGIAILLFGAIVISSIDNLLRPKLVGNEASLHPVLVFFSTLGGLVLFGITGFLLGPVIIALLISLLDIYQIEFKKELEKMNQ